jgi:hypothetical protein
MSYKKITLSQVKALARKKGPITVELYPSNCGPGGIWVKGCPVDVVPDRTGKEFFSIEYETLEARPFESLLNEYMYYNCFPQLGNRVHYYVQEGIL